MSLPTTTRLRWVSAKSPKTIENFCNNLDMRIEVKQLVFANGLWFLWFIPDDKRSDVKSGRLKDLKDE